MAVLRNSRETRRWLNALGIAKVVFWHEGYFIDYLEQIEDFIRRKRMYSPKIREDLIPELYKLSRSRKITMTKLVNGIIENYLKKHSAKNQNNKKSSEPGA